MEALPHAFAIFFFLAILFAFKYFNSKIQRNHPPKSAPQLPGAWPFVGHLPLLVAAKVPAARLIGSLVDQHGPIFSLKLGNRPAIVINTWEMVKDCFTTNDKIFATRPGIMAVGKYLGYDFAAFALAPYGPYWRDVRKLVTLELLTMTRLEKLKHVRIFEVESLTKNLYKIWESSGRLPTTKVNLTRWLEHSTFNVAIRTLAGKRFPAGIEGKIDPDDLRLKEAIKKALFLGGAFVVSDAIPALEWMDIGGHIKNMKETHKEIDGVLGEWLAEHVRRRKESDVSKGGEADFMDVMLSVLAQDAKISGHGRDEIIKATILNLILTGSESTGETLTWAFSLLLNNIHKVRIAQEELDNNVGRSRWVEESDIKNLRYLQAIVKETLRLYPPGPLSGPREAMEDCYVGGFFVPKGTRLIVNLWKLHRDSRVWTDAEEFRPERWFEEAHENVNFKGQNHEYIPFSSGRRMCPAIGFGIQVIHLFMARLLQGFDVATPGGEPVDMSEGVGLALPKVKPLDVVLTPRLPVEMYQNLCEEP